MRTFVDTNILVYAYDRADIEKHDRAVATLAELDPGDLIISTQVLSEFFVVATRPNQRLLSPQAARDAVVALSVTTVEPVDVDLVRRALDVHSTALVSYWDALILAAAVRAGCARLLTEDLTAGSIVQGVRIENPFRSGLG